MNPPAIIILGEGSLPTARKIQASLPESLIYGLVKRTQGADIAYDNFGETLRELFQQGKPLICLCATGIIIRTLAPILHNKWQEPPVMAIAEDGSAVVPLLGGLQGVNALAREIGAVLGVIPAITSTGDLRFGTALLSPPSGYQLLNPTLAKKFLADVLAGEKVRLIGEAPWLIASQLPLSPEGKLSIEIREKNNSQPLPREDCLVYSVESTAHLSIVGIGPGAREWLSPQARQALLSARDWVGYQTYLDLVESLRKPEINRHCSDNRVERERACYALDLAAQGKRVAVISSGDAGIYGMATAVFEVLEQENRPEWQNIDIQVCPGISALQAVAARFGAPIGHDFCVISLSDILKPWEIIAQRLEAAARADLVICLYNPVSRERRWQLEQAQDIILKWRSPSTPILIARSVGRERENLLIKTLAELEVNDADMQTLIMIGSSQTRVFQQGEKTWVYTPRKYPTEEIH
jgi:cobalt-precorrin 5A hydrolase/precorrin-3B C17-methyltransferase